MAKWCPQCGAEYVEGWGACSNCAVELVDRPPPPPQPADPGEPAEPPRPERGERFKASFLEPSRARIGDPFTPIWEGPTPEGSALARRLEAALIPVDLGEAAEAGRLRIEVPRSYVPEALGVLDAADADGGAVYDVPPDDDEDDESWDPISEEPFWTLSRVLVVLIAVGLVVVLILTSR